MSIDRFPERVDSQRIFRQQGVLDCDLPLAKLVRLRAYLALDEGQVHVRLQFGHDDMERRLIRGSVQARLAMQCQRSLQPVELDIEAQLSLLVVANDQQAMALPAEQESVIEDEEGIDLLSVVEDELILSLPVVARHQQDCQVADWAGRQDDSSKTAQEAEQQDKPFAILKALMDKSDSH